MFTKLIERRKTVSRNFLFHNSRISFQIIQLCFPKLFLQASPSTCWTVCLLFQSCVELVLTSPCTITLWEFTSCELACHLAGHSMKSILHHSVFVLLDWRLWSCSSLKLHGLSHCSCKSVCATSRIPSSSVGMPSFGSTAGKKQSSTCPFLFC